MGIYISQIGKKLILALILFSFLVTVMITMIQLYIGFRSGVTDIESDHDHISFTHQTSIALSLWTMDLEQIEKQLNGLLHFPHISRVSVYNEDATLVEKTSGSRSDEIITTIPLQYNHRGQELEIGKLLIASSKDILRREITTEFWVILVSNIVKYFLISIFFIYVFNFFVVRHLNDFVGYIKRQNRDEEIRPYRPKRKYRERGKTDELDEIFDAYNQSTMERQQTIRRLKNKKSELARQQNELKREIRERVKAMAEKETLEKQLLQSQKMEAIGTLAGGIAHDFNNILAAIFGYTELALWDLPEQSNARNQLRQVLKASERARELVQQILTFSRKNDLALRPLKIQLIVKEAIKLLRSSIPATVEIKQEIQKDCGHVYADPTQIHQVIMNLCTNAYHAMKHSGGVLHISLQTVLPENDHHLGNRIHLETGACLRLDVSDTGAGMSREIQEKIFEPYFTTKEKGDGTGLGLAVVHGIVKRLDGDIVVDSEPGKGTVVSVYLPVAAELGDTIQENPVKQSPKGDERILLVDDDPSIVEIYRGILENLGYTVTCFTESLETLDTFRQQPTGFDLVITDMTIPKMTGTELTEQIFAIRPDMPIILCTGHSELINEEKAEELGIKKFLKKPFRENDLAVAVREIMDADKQQPIDAAS